MTLFNDTICPAHEVELSLRKYMMATTVITPKLIDLLNMILYENYPERTKEQIHKLKKNCQTYISDCRQVVSASGEVSPDILRMTASLYALWDNILVAASIQEKIQSWEICYAIARQQKANMAPYDLIVSACAKSKAEYITLSMEEICSELIDYADEIEAWLDEYFLEEYDDYSDNEEFDRIIKIQTGLEFLAQILSNSEIE